MSCTAKFHNRLLFSRLQPVIYPYLRCEQNGFRLPSSGANDQPGPLPTCKAPGSQPNCVTMAVEAAGHLLRAESYCREPAQDVLFL
jgi:hypothetical protein